MDLLEYFHLKDWEVTMFFPYTSAVTNRFASQNYNYETPEHHILEDLWNHFWGIADAKGCRLDNKIVLRLTKKASAVELFPINIYLGRYDGIVSLGLGVNQDSWLTNKDLTNVTTKEN